MRVSTVAEELGYYNIEKDVHYYLLQRFVSLIPFLYQDRKKFRNFRLW